MRHVHYMKANEGNETPSHAIWFDTETLPVPSGDRTNTNVLNFGWAIHRRKRKDGVWDKPEYLRFTTQEQFWTWVESKSLKKTSLYLFCHNTNFDLPVLNVFKHLPEMGWKLKRAVIDAPPTILTFRKEGRTIKILDTLNHFRMSLEELGKMVGVEKMQYPGPNASPEYWDAYGKQDVVVIMEACLKWWAFIVEQDFGNFALTLAGQSLNTFRHRFMDTKILTHDNEEVLKLERAAYHGGRCEAFRIGAFDGEFSLLDVTSMFPAMMAEFNFPVRLAFYQDNPHPSVVTQYLPSFPCVALCLIETDTPIYGVVHNDKLVFPVGTFVCALAGPELNEALVRGHLRQIIRIAFYEPDAVFRAFVIELWQLRLRAILAGNAPLAWFYKILMNSLYGKFGQRGMVWEEEAWIDDLSACAWQEVDAVTGEIRKLRRLGGLVQCLSDQPESRDSSPIIAAYVTSYARLYLWGMIEAAGRENVLYCDTDSLLVTKEGRERLAGYMADNTLGALKVEGEYGHVEIYGPKDYVFGSKWKLKGARSGSVWLDPNTFEQEQWSGLKGQLRKDSLDRAETRTITKHLRRDYDKGTVGPGGMVSPLVLLPETCPDLPPAD